MMQPPHTPALQVGATFGGYRVLEEIGRGGMGEVYRAWDERLQRPVALKVPRDLGADPHLRLRFAREVRSACKVQHPYVATVFDVVESEGTLGLVMEYVEGRSILEVDRGGNANPQRIAAHALEVAEALTAIHRVGIVHRDLKPSNVMVGQDGHVKVMDFGLASYLRDPRMETTPRSSDLTIEGTLIGTPQYMSPEQVRGEPVDERSDLFSLGTLLYEVITGQHPFSRDSLVATVAAIVSEPPSGGVDPPSLIGSGALRQIVSRLLEKIPSKRYASAQAVVDDLRAFLRNEHLPTPKAVRSTRRRISITIVTAGLLVAAAVATYRLTRPPTSPVSAAPSESRQLVVVLPFEDRTGDDEGGLRGVMVADLIAAGLGDSSRLRSVSTERTAELLAGLTLASPRSELWNRLESVPRGDHVVTGTIYREGATLQAAVKVVPWGAAEGESFRVAAPQATTLADLVSAALRRRLSPEAPESGTAGSPNSDEAALLAERARRATRELRYTDAIEYLERAVALDPDYVAAQIALADVLDRAGHGRRARDVARIALQKYDARDTVLSPRQRLLLHATHARVHGSPAEELEARRALADRYGDEPEVLLALAVALPPSQREEGFALIERAAKLDPLAPNVLLQRARMLRAQNRPASESEAVFDEVERMFTAVGNVSGLAQLAMNRGNLESGRSDFQAASRHYTRAAALFRSARLPIRAVQADKALGDMELIQGRLAAAEPLLLAAIDTARAAGLHRMALNAADSLASRLFLAGRHDEAERAYREAIAQARELDNPSLLVGPLSNLSSLYMVTGRVSESSALAREARTLARASGDRVKETAASLSLAAAAFHLGEVEEAARGYRDALTLAGSSEGATYLLGPCWRGLAEVFHAQGDLAAALEAAEAAVRAAGDSPPERVQALLRRSILRTELAMITEAQSDLDAVTVLIEERSDDFAYLRPRLAQGRATLALIQGDWNDAVRTAQPDARDPRSHRWLAPLAVACRGASGLEAAMTKERPYADENLKLSRAQAPDRTSCRAAWAWALMANGRLAEAEEAARQALDEAGADGLRFSLAQSAALLLTLPGRRADAEALLHSGAEALRSWLNSAPEPQRAAIRARADLQEIFRALGS